MRQLIREWETHAQILYSSSFFVLLLIQGNIKKFSLHFEVPPNASQHEIEESVLVSRCK